MALYRHSHVDGLSKRERQERKERKERWEWTNLLVLRQMETGIFLTELIPARIYCPLLCFVLANEELGSDYVDEP